MNIKIDEIKEYFDKNAKDWDNRSIETNESIKELLTFCNIKQGDKILDIACGTGVLEKSLLDINVDKIMALDISSEMISIAKSKFDDERLVFRNCDFYKFDGTGYDCAIIFNAYPHFLDKPSLAKKLASCLKEKGRFIILHNASASEINSRHQNVAKNVSSTLKSASDEAVNFENNFDIDKVIDNDKMYLITGIKK